METVRIERVVEQSHLASVMKSGSLDVLATPQMIAWMEEASCQCISCPEGFTSVGIEMNVKHLAASGLGAKISIHSSLMAKEGNRMVFEVCAYQDDVCIGKGEHIRYLVEIDRFMAKISEK